MSKITIEKQPAIVEEKKEFENITKKAETTKNSNLLRATHQGQISIGETVLPCVVLENGTRILTQTSIFRAFKRPATGNVRVTNMPVFLDSKGLLPYVNKENRSDLLAVVEYTDKYGNVARGYKAEILPVLCNIYLEARKDGALTTRQEPLVKMAEIIVRSLSKVGMVALVDEATGYQGDRQKDELQKMLSVYISKELLSWQRKFPDEYYEQIARLKNWNFDLLSNERPQMISKITNQIVYELLPDGVLEELKRLNPPNDSGNGLHKFHQFLPQFHQFLALNMGNPNLEKHLVQIITLMRISKNWSDFEDNLYKAFPRDDYPKRLL